MSSSSQSLISAADQNAARAARFARRKRVNRIALSLSLLAMVFGVFWLVWILWETLRLGLGGLSLALFTEMTPPPNEAGGLSNAIFGSLTMVALATFVGTPIGILAGIYLSEYDTRGPLAQVTRFVNDILLSAPSIVIGLFVYTVMVTRFKSFSGYAGGLALALIVVPVVIRTTENMLLLVPAGLLLAVARIAGETAPLLFTALNNQFWNADLSKPMASLPVTIFKFAMSPYENWQKLAWAGVFLITMAVLALNIIARVLTRAK